MTDPLHSLWHLGSNEYTSTSGYPDQKQDLLLLLENLEPASRSSSLFFQMLYSIQERLDGLRISILPGRYCPRTKQWVSLLQRFDLFSKLPCLLVPDASDWQGYRDAYRLRSWIFRVLRLRFSSSHPYSRILLRGSLVSGETFVFLVITR